MSTPQKMVFVVLVFCAMTVLILPEIPYVLRMCGAAAVGAWLVVRPRRSSGKKVVSPYRTKARVRTADERELDVRSCARHWATRMLQGECDRREAIRRVRETVPGFRFQRYERDFDDALNLSEKDKVSVRARRDELIAKARQQDVFNAVFTIHFYNCRYSGHMGEYGLGHINIIDALGDVFSPDLIAEAVRRADALIEDGQQCGSRARDVPEDMAALAEAHPGYHHDHLSDAMFWGYHLNR